MLTGRNGDWGLVYISEDQNLKDVWQTINKNYIKYFHGEIKSGSELLEKYGDRTVIFAYADGGWSAFDYLVII